MLKNKICIILCFTFLQVMSQNIQKEFLYKKNPFEKKIVKATNSNEKGVEILSFLPNNMVKDASVDYRIIIQKVLDSNSVVILPDFPILIGEKGLNLRSNTTFVFQKKSKLVMEPNALIKNAVLNLDNIQNVTVISPNLEGDRNLHKGKDGEWGMGINILSSKNVKIINPQIYNCWGDGIYIGRKGDSHCENIKILGGHIDYNRRNGISVISGKNILIKNTIISNTYGTLPMSGIDIEPNTKDDFLEDIKIIDVKTFNNFNEGIKTVFIHFMGAEKKKITITVDGHEDRMSDVGFSIGGVKFVQRIYPKYDGYIKVLNSSWNKNNRSLTTGSYLSTLPNITFVNVRVDDVDIRSNKSFDASNSYINYN